jgi:hypothetical protein
MNHVPDEVLAAIDDLGWGVLEDEPTTVDERLRSDLWVRIDCDRAALDSGRADVAFRLDHGSAAATLRDHGSYVRTIADGVDSQLRGWGLDPPTAYTHRATEGDWQVYDGTLRF